MAKEVLVVDDDRALARSLVRAIESQGYACRQAHEGNAALQAIAESAPDLLLLDMLLPKKDGYGVMAALKAARATQDIPVIAMSGIYRGRDHASTGLKAGASEYLDKPFSASDLTQLLVKYLGKPQAEDPTEETADMTDLAAHPPAELIWRAIQEGFDGALHFKSGKRNKIIVMEAGVPRFLRSNLAKEALGQRLLRSGRIGQRTYDDALRRGKATGRRLGEILVDLGAIRPQELDRVLADQSTDKFLELFSWSEGESFRQPGVRTVNLASELREWGAKETILRGVQRMRLETLQRHLAPFTACKVATAILEFEEFSDPALDALLAEVTGEVTVGRLAREHASMVYGLWLVGGLRFAEDAAEKTAVGTNSNTNLQVELKAMLKRLQGQNHFEILGVERNATTADVRRAFVRKAKVYHPDKVGAGSAGGQDLAGEIFALISEANKTLSDEDTREHYLHKLETGTLGEEDGASVSRILNAEGLFRKGEELVKGRRYAEALEVLQEVIDLDPDEGEFHALYGWAAFLVNREEGSGRAAALEHLQKAIQLAPKSPSGYYYLGLARKACEEQAEAERMFREVIQLRPDHAEAASELRLIQMRRAKGNKK